MKKKKINKKIILHIVFPQLIVLIYFIAFIILYFMLGKNAEPNTNHYNYFGYWNFFNDKDKIMVPAFLTIMFGLELLSTITFQLRLWLTSKDKISAAASIGATSWMIAGLQGILLIGGSNDSIQFLIKMLPVGIATYIGIYTNNIIYKTKMFKNEKK